MKYLIYCTKADPLLVRNNISKRYHLDCCYFETYETPLNGKIVAEFECDKVEEIGLVGDETECIYGFLNDKEHYMHELLDKSCVSEEEMEEYEPTKAIKINNLKEFDEPLELNSPLLRPNKKCKDCKKMINVSCCIKKALEPNTLCNRYYGVKAPQNMCYVWYKGELCVLISIRSPYVCDIMNGVKKYEVRKKVLKEMIK